MKEGEFLTITVLAFVLFFTVFGIRVHLKNNGYIKESMNKVLVVVDCQNDFIDGSLANPAAVAAVPNIVEKIRKEAKEGDLIVATLDTHGENYLETREGKFLPVVHCIKGTDGWKINDNIQAAINDAELRGVKVLYVEKPTFGSYDLIKLTEQYVDENTEIEIVGFVSSICVVSNALMLKAKYYENEVALDTACTAGLGEANNQAALEVMKSCQITLK